ncbi:putative disease resistance RPP13-like protein 2 [Brachypodium distachyon]|uniref:Rx N-terminal domain-containing protein n=1 Tax=Brachypodium distachyon TaxID=15368 RepID=I1INK4_BRADI|nr:putative disease resistance RPP13-like protein 2 [Brachypodium distachyon]KQJ89455.1 hypothetical protein BRADI_4g25810v3 [Brachypodium distachyon]|eukprot:XP_024319439.1 putative disease resistance RPP13-like protein 2 [Brachypodium distachyon]
MAETAITSVLSKCGELATRELVREAKVLLKVGDDIMLLRDRLEWLQAFVRDADRKRRVGTDDLTRIWVRQTRDVAFEVEDALDEFFHKVDLDIQGRRGWKLWLGHLNINRLAIRHVLSSQIEKIKSRLDQISENQKEYNIEYAPSAICTSANMALLSREDLQKVVGIEKDATSLADLLLGLKDHRQKMSFISIVGESGAGKSTLGKEIHSKVVENFDIVVSYTMPPNCSMEDLLTQIYCIAQEQAGRAADELEGHGSSASCEEGGINKLHDLLRDKRYLLILGGISSKIILNCVAASLPDSKTSSCVVLLLEPENKEVASHAANLNHPDHIDGGTHQLSRLDEEGSADLFRWRVFGAEGEKMKGSRKKKKISWPVQYFQSQGDQKNQAQEEEQEVEQMKRYEKDVYHITGGHPLAIVVLAGLLRTKERPVEWDAVLQHLKPGREELAQDNNGGGNGIAGVVLSKDKSAVEWVVQQIESPAGEAKLSNRMAIERILSSSFDDLPQDLKSCFLYFAAYPKDLTHGADRLVWMWTAEGFIRPHNDDKTMEELGQVYLQELVSRSLVESEKSTDDSCDGIKQVRVHNRLLMFLQSEAREASFIEMHAKNDVLAPASVRRLSIQNDSGRYVKFTNNYKFPKLRSFIYRISEQVQCPDNSGQDMTLMRGETTFDLKFLCGSKFLRVLSMQGSNLTELPDEIGDMSHLRYLRVNCKQLKKLPPSIKKLLNLQTLDIRTTGVAEIHQDFWLIKTLRHVLAHKLTLPLLVENMQELGDLQTLHGVQLKQQKEDTQPFCGFLKRRKSAHYPLDMMSKLRSLEICGFNHKDHADALEISLRKMHLLGHLKLAGDQIPLCVFTEPGLQRLQTMVLDGTVDWSKVIELDISHKRPNLISVKVKQITAEQKIILDGENTNETKLGTLLSY